MLYQFLKLIVGLGIRLYYKRIVVKNIQFLDHEGPMIIIANHPNTLMDAWMVGHVCKQPIYYMAKGTFFNSPFKKWILKGLNMIPINRQTDIKVKGVNNADSFEECYSILEEGKTLVIFPEGNSHLERQLRQLKSGAARIALETEKRNNRDLNLKIVPMGIFYAQAEKFRSSVLINIGQGIRVTDHVDLFTENSGLAAKKLTEKFRLILERVLVTAENSDQEKMIEELFHFLREKEDAADIEKGAAFMQELKERVEEIQLLRPYLIADIQQLLQSIRWQSEKLQIQTDFVNRRFRSRLYLMQITLSILFLLIGLPLFLFGIAHNFLQYKSTDLLIPRLTKYVEYYAALGVLIGLILYPASYFGFVFLADHFLEISLWLKLLYFCSMPLSGIYAHTFAKYLKRTGHKWKYIFLIFNEKEALKDLQLKRKKLGSLLYG
ncbi:MAG: lysophospholipid acyltransferase family protein [Flavobacteriia bacterium]|jgi:1-acyl-sn-glycerol-3-phosphate acyltransferase